MPPGAEAVTAPGAATYASPGAECVDQGLGRLGTAQGDGRIGMGRDRGRRWRRQPRSAAGCDEPMTCEKMKMRR